MDEVFVSLIDILRSAAGPAIDGVDGDVQDCLAEHPGPFALGDQHADVKESTEVEYPQNGGFGAEVYFGTKLLSDG